MINIKSFFRKKTTKNYIIISALIFLIMGLLFVGKVYFRDYINKTNYDSYIEVHSDMKLPVNDKNIKAIERGIILDDGRVLTEDTTDNFKISIYEFNEIWDSSNKEDKYLIISLKDWLEVNKSFKQIINIYSANDVRIIQHDNSNINTTEIFGVFNLFLIFLILMFIIIFVITFNNVLYNEKNNIKMLSFLGYNKKQIIHISNMRMLLIIIFSQLTSFIFFMILFLSIKLFYNISFGYIKYFIELSLLTITSTVIIIALRYFFSSKHIEKVEVRK